MVKVPATKRSAGAAASTSARSASPVKPSSSGKKLGSKQAAAAAALAACSESTDDAGELVGKKVRPPSHHTSPPSTSPLKRTIAINDQQSTSSSSSATKKRPKASSLSKTSNQSSRATSDSEDVESEDSAEDGEDGEAEAEVPRRKAGFGKLSQVSTARSISSTSKEESTDEVHAAVDLSRDVLPDTAGRDVEAEPEVDETVSREENVVVCLRVRPVKPGMHSSSIYHFLGAEDRIMLDGSHPTFAKRGAMSKGTAGGLQSGEYDFRFDALHLSPASTEMLYERKIRPVIRATMQGFNGTVFAYGQTASGKTHTMMGNPSEIGIIPLAIHELFAFILDQDTLRTFSLRVSFLEIYNEVFADLLTSTTRSGAAKPLEVHGDDGMVKGLVERPVNSPDEVMHLLAEGEKRRRVGMTDWNERSSRSHCVFIVTIESTDTRTGGAARTSRLNLIDLAGSESATGQSDRQKEGSFINKSLLTLGTVIAKLTEPRSAHSHIPFRDTKLTRLLQPALSGRSRVAIICTISPDAEQATETLSTLKFAKRAKMVVTKAERNDLVTDQMMLRRYAAEVENLKAAIAAGETAVADGELARERDSARAQVGELRSQKDHAEAELARKELELNHLKAQLEHTTSFLLTGPVLEATTRRTSGQFASGSRDWMSSSTTPGRSASAAQRTLGIGTPRDRMRTASTMVMGSPRIGTSERELALEVELEQSKAALTELKEKDDELSTLREHVDRLKRSTSLARVDAETFAAAGEQVRLRVRELECVIIDLQQELADSQLTHATKDSTSMQESAAKVKELAAKLSEAEDESKDQSLSMAKMAESTRVQVDSAKEKEVELVEKLKVERAKRKKIELELADSRSTGLELTDSASATHQQAIDELSSAYRVREAKWNEEREAMKVQHDEEIAVLNSLAKDAIDRLEFTERLRESTISQLSITQSNLLAASASTSTLEEKTASLEIDLRQRQSTIDQLSSSLNSYRKADEIRSTYATQQKLGKNGLKNKIAELTARSSSSSGGVVSPTSTTATSSRSLRSSTSTLTSEVDDGEIEALRSRNEVLAATVARLEQQLEQLDGSEIEGLRVIILQKDDMVEECRRKEEEWKSMYLESQRIITSSSSSFSTARAPRTHLAELNLSSRSHPALPLLPAKVAATSGSSSSPIRSSQPRSYIGASTAHLPPFSPSASSSTNTFSNVPPPLPYSPRNQEAARRLRRETLDKELGALQASQSIERTKEALCSPRVSPIKETGVRREATRLGKKGGNDGEYWS